MRCIVVVGAVNSRAHVVHTATIGTIPSHFTTRRRRFGLFPVLSSSDGVHMAAPNGSLFPLFKLDRGIIPIKRLRRKGFPSRHRKKDVAVIVSSLSLYPFQTLLII